MRTAALIILYTLAACAKNDDPTKAPYWIDRLEEPKQRTQALNELGKLKDKSAVPHAVKLLKEEGDWQPEAAYTIGQLGDASAVPDLLAAIDYQVGNTRDRAAVRKGRINQNIARALGALKAKEGVDALLRLAGSNDDKTKEAAVRALGDVGDPRAVDALIAIADGEKQPFIRKMAIEALGKLGDPKAVPVLVKDLYVEVPGISFYYEARFSLLQIGEAAIPELIATMQRKNQGVESIRIGTDQAELAEGAIEAKAAFVLGSLRAKQAEDLVIASLDKYYKRFLKRNSEPVFASVPGAVMELAYALGNLGTAKAVKALAPIAADKGEDGPNMRLAACEALTTLGDASATKVLFAPAKSGALDLRMPAILAISRLGGGDDLAAFDALGKGDEAAGKVVQAERVRLVAAKECKHDVACWKGKLADADAKVRERAAWQLGWMNAKDAIPELLKTAEDSDVMVRMAASIALGRVDGVKPEPLEKIVAAAEPKVEYKDANAELKRLIARLQ
jgi:HEAT repeat protein